MLFADEDRLENPQSNVKPRISIVDSKDSSSMPFRKGPDKFASRLESGKVFAEQCVAWRHFRWFPCPKQALLLYHPSIAIRN